MMSIFPAYNTNVVSESSNITTESQNDTIDWLTNSSFQALGGIPGSSLASISSDSSDCEFLEKKGKSTTDISPEDNYPDARATSKRQKKHKKHKSRKKSKPTIKYEPIVEQLYFEDKIRDRGNFKVDTLCSRARPIYNTSSRSLGFVPFKSRKKTSLKRYFALCSDQPKKSMKSGKTIGKNVRTVQSTGTDPPPSELLKTSQQTLQEEAKSKIQQFNEELSEDPHNINLWIEYINFNDRHDNFDTYAHTNVRTEIVRYQRKLAITEKALEENPNAASLLKLKVHFLGELFPADEYSSQLERLISKDPGNIILWQALMGATRSSTAICTAPNVIALYTKCFQSLHLWCRSNSKIYDNNLLEMLFQCLLFLRHAGLWEHMWEVLRMNLTLNLGIMKDSKYFKSSVDEKKLIEMEEVVLTCQLPLNQLWLRVESLRENCHWITISKDELELIGDSHRFISPEEVPEFVHPLLSTGSNFKLAIYALLTLKVPLLPTRHSIIDDLKMDNCNWTIDSIESLLPIIFPFVGAMTGYEKRISLFKGLIDGGLSSGPQYLKFHPAQQAYLDFVRDAFCIIADKLTIEDRNQIYVWWLRFERCLLAVQKTQVQIANDKSIKKLKGILKDFFKKNDNRNNLDFYREYALIEREMGKHENCLNILETAIGNKGYVISNIQDSHEQSALMSLYKTLIECLLDTPTWHVDNKTRIMEVFGKMSVGISQEDRLNATEKYLENMYEEFINISQIPEVGLNQYFQPNLYHNTVMCYVYYLYIAQRNFQDIHTIFEKCIERSRENLYLEELFREGEIIFQQLIDERNDMTSDNQLQKDLAIALKRFPDNFYMLSVFIASESELPNWCVGKSKQRKRLWAAISLCLSGRLRLSSALCREDLTARIAALNKLLHLHKRFAKIAEVRCCPLFWRLYMLLLREENLCEKNGEEMYHDAVAACPWARCIYIDAAEIAPQLLTQIQDLIKEKDLRMHVTPEELDILRG